MFSQAVTLATLTALLAIPLAAAPAMIHLAPNGNDANPGTAAQPLQSLTAARDAVRKLSAAGLPDGGAIVELAGGVYELQAPLELAKQDSGQPGKPIVWRAAAGAEVHLVGGKVVSGWSKVTDPVVLAKLAPDARGQVVQADLKAQGVTDLGEMKAGSTWAQSDPGLELFFDDQPQTLARWPNEGFVKITALHGPTEVDVRGTKGCREPIFEIAEDRAARWVGEPDIMVEGYWFWDWADQRLKVKSYDPATRIFTLEDQPVHSYGFRKGQWFYAYNLLTELDQPGEWYLDRAKGVLYFWPPKPIDQGRAMVSVTPTLLSLTDVSHLDLRGLIIEAVRETAVIARNVEQVRLVACTLRNIGSFGVSMTGKESGVLGCDLYNLGDGGVSLNGGDRNKLIPAKLFVENCVIHHFSRWDPVYKPAVAVNGVGQIVRHNLMYESPHMAISFSGNDHLIELNEIHSVVYQSNDAGVMYAGRNCTMRGHVIKNNYIHHIYGYEGRGCVGIYLDDMFCSAEMTGNVFYRVPRATFIGGGRDNAITNNIYVECNPAVHIDDRALGWAAGGMTGILADLEKVPYREEPWKSRFPQLLTYAEDEPAVPKGNLVARNICVGGKFDGIYAKARPGTTLENNLVDEDPHFVDAASLNFQLKDDSPAYAMGFQKIPFEQIGPYASPDRASWPVASEVRPAPEKPAAAPPEVRKNPVVVTPEKTTTKLTVDGTIDPGEWTGPGFKVAQGIDGKPVTPESQAWLATDGTNLRVALVNGVNTSQPIKMTNIWGQDDAVEIAIQPGSKLNDPILILRGYPNGHWESSDESGAPAAMVKQAAQGVQYGAKIISNDRWSAEFSIPWKSLGIDPSKASQYWFNLSVRKPAGDLWVLWQGTAGHTWDVLRAGQVAVGP